MKELFLLIWRRQWKDLFYTQTSNGWVQLFRYGFVGGGAFVVDFSVYFLLELCGLHYLLAGIVSFVAGFAFNFLLSRWLIFRADSTAKVEPRELVSVLLISVIGLILTELLLFAGSDLLHLDNRIAKIIASVLVLFWNYAARKYFVYRG